jgi:circadian clock protein KaiC
MPNKLPLHRLSTHVPGLDKLLGGGIPEYSFNIIAGSPGSGKTTLAHQMMFAMAKPDNPILFFTVVGEPSLKMLRYQQQFSFFDSEKLNRSIRFVNLTDDLIKGAYSSVLARISKEMKNFQPKIVMIDSFRSIADITEKVGKNESDFRIFMYQLGQQLIAWQTTCFAIGEYAVSDEQSTALLTVADGILWLTQNLHHNSVVRKIQVIKMRGQDHMPGLHTFRINEAGLKIFPRAILPPELVGQSAIRPFYFGQRLSMGVVGLDEMMGGGLPAGYSLLVAGPSGSGKTIMATEFLAEGVRRGEPGVIAAFEKSPRQLLSNKLHALLKDEAIGIIDTHSLDLSIDETLYDLISMIEKMSAKRVVIDSLSGFEMALAPEFREDYRESLYRMISVLTAKGVSVLMTSEVEDRYTDLRFSSYGNAFLADAIILHRYVEIAGTFKRAMSVVKVRGSAHSKDIRLFDIDGDDIKLGAKLETYEGIFSGRPTTPYKRDFVLGVAE